MPNIYIVGFSRLLVNAIILLIFSHFYPFVDIFSRIQNCINISHQLSKIKFSEKVVIVTEQNENNKV